MAEIPDGTNPVPAAPAFAVSWPIAIIGLVWAAALHADEMPAPEYAARLLGTAEEVNVASLRGQVVLLNTWATWCVPCREEMPVFESFYQRYRTRGLTVIGVNIDEGKSDAAVQRYVKAMEVSFPIWRDPQNRFAKRFRVLGVPETLLLNRQGIIEHHWRGIVDLRGPEQIKIIAAALDAKVVQAPSSPAGLADEAAAKRGRRLAEQRGCLNCHSIDGSASVGPTWKGLLGSPVEFSDGRRTVRDRDYLERAIREPDVEIVAGYSKGVMVGAMPGKPLSDTEIASLVLYLATL